MPEIVKFPETLNSESEKEGTPAVPAALPDRAAQQDTAIADTGSASASRSRPAKPGYDRPRIWLPAAAAGLGVLAGAAAAVSYAAQYRLVYAARHLAVAAVLEAAIPDAAALVFACLGVALAVHGRRAIRARLLNVASAGASVFMNVIAAAPGWRDLAVWAMPPTAYALASDTLIGVVRTGAVARHPMLAGPARDFSFLAAAGGLALWLLRLTMAPRSTLAGFRAWVIEECPVAPGEQHAWEVSWLPGRHLNRNEAVTAMVLADTTANAGVHPRHRAWPHIEDWAAKLGMTGTQALDRIVGPPRWARHQEKTAEPPDLESRDVGWLFNPDPIDLGWTDDPDWPEPEWPDPSWPGFACGRRHPTYTFNLAVSPWYKEHHPDKSANLWDTLRIGRDTQPAPEPDKLPDWEAGQ